MTIAEIKDQLKKAISQNTMIGEKGTEPFQLVAKTLSLKQSRLLDILDSDACTDYKEELRHQVETTFGQMFYETPERDSSLKRKYVRLETLRCYYLQVKTYYTLLTGEKYFGAY